MAIMHPVTTRSRHPASRSFSTITRAACSLLLPLLMCCSVPGNLHSAPSPQSGSVRKAEDQFLLGRSYARGEGVPQSYEKAGEWYLKAAEAGNTKAMHNLAILYLNGQGTRQDTAAAVKWLTKAAEAGDPKACTRMAIFLLTGTNVTKDQAKGGKLLRKAADLGEPAAMARLADDLLNGDEGFTKDPTAAAALLSKAADGGNGWACGILGIKYERGEGVPADMNKAQAYFEKGAYLGDHEAQSGHARMLLGTQGPAAAYPWVKLALEQPPAVSAIGLLSEVETAMTDGQRKAGDAELEKIRQALPKP